MKYIYISKGSIFTLGYSDDENLSNGMSVCVCVGIVCTHKCVEFILAFV